MRMRSLAVATVLLGALAGTALGQALSKDQIEKAKQHYLAATAAEQKGDYATAIAEFTAAYDVTKDPKLFYQIAHANELAGKIDEALIYYRRFLNEAKLSPQAQGETQDKIDELEASRITKPPNGDEVLPLGTPPPGGDENPEQPPSFMESKPGWQRTAAWVSVGLTAAFLTTAGVLATSASSRAEDIDRLTTFRSPTTGLPSEYTGTVKEQYESAQDEGKSLKKYSLIAFIGAGVCAAGAVTFFILDATRKVEPVITPEGAGVTTTWTF